MSVLRSRSISSSAFSRGVLHGVGLDHPYPAIRSPSTSRTRPSWFRTISASARTSGTKASSSFPGMTKQATSFPSSRSSARRTHERTWSRMATSNAPVTAAGSACIEAASSGSHR